MIFHGWGTRIKKHADAGVGKCPACRNYGVFEIHKTCQYVHVYWIPFIIYNRRYSHTCTVCRNAQEIDKRSRKAAIARLPNL